MKLSPSTIQTLRRVFLGAALTLATPALAVSGLCWEQVTSIICCFAPSPRTCISNQPGNTTTWDCRDTVNFPSLAITQAQSPPKAGGSGRRGLNYGTSVPCLRTSRSCKSIDQPPAGATGCDEGETSVSICTSVFVDTLSLPCPGPPAVINPELPTEQPDAPRDRIRR